MHQTLIELLATDSLKQIKLSDQSGSADLKEIKKRIGQFHTQFKTLGIVPSTKIAIMLPRSVNAMIAVYAVIAFGCVYVPIDDKAPLNRKNYIIQDINPVLVIDELFISNLPSHAMPQYHTVNRKDLAAILYTSGSTGKPKGIALSHQAILFFVNWTFHAFQMTAADRIASLAPLHFDLSLFDLFVPWFCDCQVAMIPQEHTSFPARLTEFLRQQNITIWYTVPSMLNFWQHKGAINASLLNNLRAILFAGEIFPLAQLKKLMTQLPHTEFYNLYGPTETNVCTAFKVADKDTLPIGYALPGIDVKIHPQKQTLLVKGDNLFSGYWINGKLQIYQDEWFDTNDVVSVGEDNEYYYHGRFDRQVKIAGHRVELGEIEQIITAYASIKEAAVMTNVASERTYLVTYFVANDIFNLSELIQYLKSHLPSYMLPEKFHQLEVLPRLSNGKLDLLTLKEMSV